MRDDCNSGDKGKDIWKMAQIIKSEKYLKGHAVEQYYHEKNAAKHDPPALVANKVRNPTYSAIPPNVHVRILGQKQSKQNCRGKK